MKWSNILSEEEEEEEEKTTTECEEEEEECSCVLKEAEENQDDECLNEEVLVLSTLIASKHSAPHPQDSTSTRNSSTRYSLPHLQSITTPSAPTGHPHHAHTSKEEPTTHHHRITHATPTTLLRQGGALKPDWKRVHTFTSTHTRATPPRHLGNTHNSCRLRGGLHGRPKWVLNNRNTRGKGRYKHKGIKEGRNTYSIREMETQK